MASNLQVHEELYLSTLSILQLSRQSAFPRNQTQMPTFLALLLKCYIVVFAHTNDVCQEHKAASFRAFNAAILKRFVLPTSYI